VKKSSSSKADRSNGSEQTKSGVKSSETSSNVKTGNVEQEQKMKRTDASWKK